MTGALSPLSMLFVSEILMLFFAVISFGLIPIINKFIRLKPAHMIAMFEAGITNGIIAPYLWFLGLSRTTAVNAEIFGRSEMLFLIIFTAFILHNDFRKSHILGGFAILCGLITVTTRGFNSNFAFYSGDWIILTAASFYALGGTIVRAKISHIEPELHIFIRAISMIIFFAAISPFVENPLSGEIAEFPLDLIPVLISFGLLSRFVTVFSFYKAIERVPISTLTSMSSLTTAFSALFAFLYLGEDLGWHQIIGGMLIIIGALYVNFHGLHRDEKHMKQHLKMHHRHHI